MEPQKLMVSSVKLILLAGIASWPIFFLARFLTCVELPVGQNRSKLLRSWSCLPMVSKALMLGVHRDRGVLTESHKDIEIGMKPSISEPQRTPHLYKKPLLGGRSFGQNG